MCLRRLTLRRFLFVVKNQCRMIKHGSGTAFKICLDVVRFILTEYGWGAMADLPMQYFMNNKQTDVFLHF